MFPFIEPVLVRLHNKGSRPVKIGYQVISAGKWADVPVGTLHSPALTAARNSGVEFVGLVVGDCLCDLIPMEMPEEEVVEVVEKEEEVVVKEKKTYVSSDEFADTTEKESAEKSLREVGLSPVSELEENTESEEEVVDYSSMLKKELIEVAEGKGMEVEGLKKQEILDMLEQ